MAYEPDLQRFQNRVLNAVALHVDDEARFGVENADYSSLSPKALELRRRHLSGVVQGFRRDRELDSSEKLSLKYARHELRKVRYYQNPTFLQTLLYAQPLRWIVNFLRGRQQYYNAINRIMKDIAKRTTIDLNAADLQQTLNEYGFVNQLEGPLKARMAYGPDEFSFRTPETRNSDTNYLLHFKKKPGSDTYYFAGLEASRRDTGTHYTDQKIQPSLLLRTSDKIQFNATEARDLVHGHPVHKNIKGKVDWFLISRDGSYIDTLPFNLEQQLASLPIKEMGIPTTRELLLNDLNDGKEAFITLQLPDGQEKGLIIKLAYDQQNRTINLEFRDENGKVDAFDLVKDRSAARQILQNIKTAPLKSRNLQPV
ncbi:hypothetical protein [Puia dinghuensis]|uniref:Uncharacterized protein n=1 Tax=Puia dinghuensis TaxID=1792502 RepID=A0A8J2UBQ1_9BACT|nr:hypothetical protein [Puia dinghuensis]GGA92894.1 hypothetical protein GCM10011511_15380 [Puia dinghuensis]